MAFEPTFSVIVPTIGRPTLNRTIESIRTQDLRTGDGLYVIRDDPPHNDWGCWARTQGISNARGTHLLFMDDDDEYVPGAFKVIRFAVSHAPNRVHIFRMQRLAPYHDILWNRKDISVPGQVGSALFAMPNDDRLGAWTERYEGDFDFLVSTLARHDAPPIWHQDIIAIYHHDCPI